MNSQNNKPEQRQELRLNTKETVYIELSAALPQSNSIPEILACQSIDISANGLQLRLDQAVEIGSLLNIVIQSENGVAPLQLVAEVRWLIEIPDNQGYMAGFCLVESDHTQLADWKHFIANSLRQTEDM